MKRKIVFVIISLLLSNPLAGFACEPCEPMLSWEESALQADLIIVGENIESGPVTDLGGEQAPAWMDVKVKRVFKGESPSEVIRIDNHACNYGIYFKQGQDHVVFLKKYESEYGLKFDAVNLNGCARKSLPINQGNVVVVGKQILLEDFLKQLGVLAEIPN